MKAAASSVTLPSLWFLLLAATIISCGCSHGRFNDATGGCNQIEKEALLKFKNGLVDPSNRLASWSVDDADCCRWYGVICDNFTGHVSELHLRSLSGDEYYATNENSDYPEYRRTSTFRGTVSESLLNLKQLKYLDLSYNYFGGIQIPRFLGSMESLVSLNLSEAGFSGMVPPQLGNLSNLQYLNLKDYLFDSLKVENLAWLSNLRSLKFLDLSQVDLSIAFDWFDVLNTLPSLVELHLSSCPLPLVNHPHQEVNFSSLVILDLYSSLASDEGLVPQWIFGVKTLTSLHLSWNHFVGEIPVQLSNLTSLRELDLRGNLFNSSIPNWFHGFANLDVLDLSSNELGGKIPSALGNLTSLSTLDLSYNSLEGELPISFKNLCNLRSLGLSYNKLRQEVNDIFGILSGCVWDTLESLKLSSNQLSGHFTLLGELKNLVYLDFSDNRIDGPIPVPFGGLNSLKEVDISGNLLEGEVSDIHFANLTNLESFKASGNHLKLRVRSDWIPPFQGVENLALGSWQVGPQFPTWIHSLKHLKILDLSNSKISSTIPTWFYNWSFTLSEFNLSNNQMHGTVPHLSIQDSSFSAIDLSSNNFVGSLPNISSNIISLHLSKNSFSGSISSFLCDKKDEVKSMRILDLGENLLSGDIPDCWMNWGSLHILRLQNNFFCGKIPRSIGNLSNLRFLNLRNNNLSGEIPFSLKHCKGLELLDLSENELREDIPTWIGELQYLSILNLRRNKLSGLIPKEICQLNDLQILDAADNNLNGTIPRCVNNFTAMLGGTISQFEGKLSILNASISSEEDFETSWVMKNGKLVEYGTILGFVRSLDFSNNKLSGEIPEEITSLTGLQFLNLSDNFLVGRIPKDIGVMKAIQSLDFSQNQLSGEIPQSMASLTFLNNLNLSNNQLSGIIPSSTQLQSFDPSSFRGNNLCGPPLTQNCSRNDGEHDTEKETTEEDGMNWFYFYMSIAPGFVIGFWGVVGPLVFNRRWRHLYFNCLNNLWNKIWEWFYI